MTIDPGIQNKADRRNRLWDKNKGGGLTAAEEQARWMAT